MQRVHKLIKFISVYYGLPIIRYQNAGGNNAIAESKNAESKNAGGNNAIAESKNAIAESKNAGGNNAIAESKNAIAESKNAESKNAESKNTQDKNTNIQGKNKFKNLQKIIFASLCILFTACNSFPPKPTQHQKLLQVKADDNKNSEAEAPEAEAPEAKALAAFNQQYITKQQFQKRYAQGLDVQKKALAKIKDAEVNAEVNGDLSTQIELLSSVQRYVPRSSLFAESSNLKEASEKQIKNFIKDDIIVDVVVTTQELPVFIDTMFGVLLDLPYIMDKDILQLKDQVTLRGSSQTTKSELFVIAQETLKNYGVITTIRNNIVYLEKAKSFQDITPIFLNSRSNQRVPESLRPVVYYYEFKSLSAVSIVSLFETSFPNKDVIKFSNIRSKNILIISGQSEQVKLAVSMAQRLDQPYFAGGRIAYIDPVYWSAEELTSELLRVLNAEGIQVTNSGGEIKRAVMIIPIKRINRLLIFSNYNVPFKRALFWAKKLDAPSNFGDQVSVFVYKVQNTDAQSLSGLISSVLSQGNLEKNKGKNLLSVSGNQITADLAGNRILFRGTATEFEQTKRLLKTLDTAAPQVLLEVTIAELTLDDETSYGLDFFIQNMAPAAEGTVLTKARTTASTEGKVGVGSAGLVINLNSADIRAKLNAYAKNKRVNILSTPRVVARSGGEAYFQVGSEVPVIVTRSGTAINQSGKNNTDILQTISYRKTGVILQVAPIVYGDNRIDITISQEVSATDTNITSTSPTISNRTITSQMTVSEGTTAVLGGLIQRQVTNEEAGIPFLKDIPLLGNIFKSKKIVDAKTELVIFITAYILKNDIESSLLAHDFAKLIKNNGINSLGRVFTLSPRPQSPLKKLAIKNIKNNSLKNFKSFEDYRQKIKADIDN